MNKNNEISLQFILNRLGCLCVALNWLQIHFIFSVRYNPQIFFRCNIESTRLWMKKHLTLIVCPFNHTKLLCFVVEHHILLIIPHHIQPIFIIQKIQHRLLLTHRILPNRPPLPHHPLPPPAHPHLKARHPHRTDPCLSKPLGMLLILPHKIALHRFYSLQDHPIKLPIPPRVFDCYVVAQFECVVAVVDLRGGEDGGQNELFDLFWGSQEEEQGKTNNRGRVHIIYSMKIQGAKNSEDMFGDDKDAIPTDMVIEQDNPIAGLQTLPPRNTLIQEFGDFSFLLQLQKPEHLKIGQVFQDIKKNRDHFLNDNIKSIITFASTLKEQQDFNFLMTIVKQILRRKCTHSHEIVSLMKFCFLFRRLIEISGSYDVERCLTLHRELMDSHENHYNSSFTNTHIITEMNLVQGRMNEIMGFEIEEEYPFQGEVVVDPSMSPLYQVYVGQLLKINILDRIHNTLPSSLDILAKIQKFVNPTLVEAILPTTLLLNKIQQYLLAVPNDNQAVSRQQIEHILKCAEQICSDGSQQKRQKITEMELQTASIFFKSPSMDKKLWALSVINDKIRLLRMGNKSAGIELGAFLEWLESIGIYQAIVQQNVHPEVLARSSQLMRFLYEKERIGQDDIENLIKFTIKSESDSISKFAHNLIIILDYKHLESVFHLVELNSMEKNQICAASIKIIESITSAHIFNSNDKDKKTKRKRTYSGAKDEKKGKGSKTQVDLFDDGTLKPSPSPSPELPLPEPKPQPSPLLIRIFNFLISHLDEQTPLLPVLTKLLNCQPMLFSMIPQQLINAIRHDRNNSIAFLDSMMRLQFPIGKEKGTWSKHEFVTWLANEGMFQYLLAGIARNRFGKSLNQRLQVLVLLGRNYKPFEKGYIEFLWKILGLRALDERQREQFFVFVKDCLVRSNTEPLFTQQAVNYVYFQILLRLQSAWFSLKIYECFQMFFMRLNQDCKLISPLPGSTSTTGYQLLDPQLIGLNKFWYIYLTCDDFKVTKKCKDFLCRLVSKFDCEDKIFSTIKKQYVIVILDRMKESLKAFKSQEGLTPEAMKLNKLQMSRCLEMIIRVIEELEGKKLSGEKGTVVEELTFNVQNNIQEALPPKKFTIKFDAQATIKQLKELIGSKINPPKKGKEIKLMTQGKYIKGQNLTMKQMKFQNKQHFFVEVIEQIQPQTPALNEQLFNNMKSMFPNHTQPIIRYVLFKRQGEDQQTIAEVLLDDFQMAKYQQEMQAALPSVSKQISEMLSSTQDFFEIFFEVLSLQCQELSLLTWKIISNIPNNPFHTELIRDTILKTNDWNEIISMNASNLFKTLYNLQLLRTMLRTGDMHEDLSQKFVVNGGFEHLYKISKVMMQKWTGDALEAKLLGSLLQVIKIYIKPQLQAQLKKPLLFFFKQVTNYRNHLKDIAQDDIQSIVTQIITPELPYKDYTSKSQSSFSFKGQSNSSNLTPNFQSPNNSRSNSPHSQKPDKDQDNLSSFSGSKSSNLPKKRDSSKHDSFTVKMQQNVNLQLQLNQVINTQELTKMILYNLGIIVRTQNLEEDVVMLSEELFDVLFPSLLVNSEESVYKNQETMGMITHGVAFGSNQQLRVKLVYLVFLFCVISDILNEKKKEIRNDDELFMTTNNRIQNPRVTFIHELLPLFQPKCSLHETYFTCLTKLIKEVSTEELEKLLSPEALIKQAIDGILARPFIEEHDNEAVDYTFNGLLAMLQVLLERYKQYKQQYSYIVPEIFSSLFALPQDEKDMPNAKNYPKCKKKSTRQQCFGLLLELAKDNTETRKLLTLLLCQYCVGLTPKEYQSTVMRTTQKYPGLRNLGATCYINSLLQQIHKNTLLPQMLCCRDIIPVDKGTPLFPLAHLMASLSLSIKNTINPTEFIKSIKFHGNVEIDTRVQQDVNEFFMAFGELLQSNNARALLQSNLMGEICNQISAEDNQRKFVKKGIQTFFTITLDIKGKKSLTQALQLFIKADILDGDNMYHSQQLGKKVRATKRSYFRKLPNTLVFTLKRFQFDYNTMLRYKLNDYLQFPIQLDILRFSQQHISEQSQNLFDQNYYKYRLSGVLVHSGSAESGHYYSFIRDAEKWYEFNDNVVTEFNITNLKAETFGGEESTSRGDWDGASSRSKNAYLLFYQRVQPIENSLIVQVKDRLIKGEFFDMVWKENLQFLKARLVFDADFLKFVEDILEMTKDQQLSDLLKQLKGGNKKELPKTDVEVQEIKGIEPIVQEAVTWSGEDSKVEEKLIKDLMSENNKTAEERLD